MPNMWAISWASTLQLRRSKRSSAFWEAVSP
jgi:hypothetical protein